MEEPGQQQSRLSFAETHRCEPVRKVCAPPDEVVNRAFQTGAWAEVPYSTPLSDRCPQRSAPTNGPKLHGLSVTDSLPREQLVEETRTVVETARTKSDSPGDLREQFQVTLPQYAFVVV